MPWQGRPRRSDREYSRRQCLARLGVGRLRRRTQFPDIVEAEAGARQLAVISDGIACSDLVLRAHLLELAGGFGGAAPPISSTRHGDQRDPKVDAVDWVERIPFSETRNYVQRVMENLQVYRARFGASIATLEPNLHRTATVEMRAKTGTGSVIPSSPWAKCSVRQQDDGARRGACGRPYRRGLYVTSGRDS